jgi:transcriptional regulator GlxA family with amidase domain
MAPPFLHALAVRLSQAWINRHLASDLSLSVLANQAGMSERSFSRHYAEATGRRPPAPLSG